MKSLVRSQVGSGSDDHNKTRFSQPWLMLHAVFRMCTGRCIGISESHLLSL